MEFQESPSDTGRRAETHKSARYFFYDIFLLRYSHFSQRSQLSSACTLETTRDSYLSVSKLKILNGHYRTVRLDWEPLTRRHKTGSKHVDVKLMFVQCAQVRALRTVRTNWGSESEVYEINSIWSIYDKRVWNVSLEKLWTLEIEIFSTALNSVCVMLCTYLVNSINTFDNSFAVHDLSGPV